MVQAQQLMQSAEAQVLANQPHPAIDASLHHLMHHEEGN